MGHLSTCGNVHSMVDACASTTTKIFLVIHDINPLRRQIGKRIGVDYVDFVPARIARKRTLGNTRRITLPASI